jgi:hypothetical protein
LAVSILTTPWFAGKPSTPVRAADSMSSVSLGGALLGVTDATPPGTLTGVPPPKPGEISPGFARTPIGYLLPFEIVSVHLLVVLIGAAYLARAKRRRIAGGPVS